MNKADKVKFEYYDAKWDNYSSEGCYSVAVREAWKLGGVEVENSNDGNSSKSFAPNITFEFDDGSAVQVTYGGVFVIEPSA